MDFFAYSKKIVISKSYLVSFWPLLNSVVNLKEAFVTIKHISVPYQDCFPSKCGKKTEKKLHLGHEASHIYG